MWKSAVHILPARGEGGWPLPVLVPSFEGCIPKRTRRAVYHHTHTQRHTWVSAHCLYRRASTELTSALCFGEWGSSLSSSSSSAEGRSLRLLRRFFSSFGLVLNAPHIIAHTKLSTKNPAAPIPNSASVDALSGDEPGDPSVVLVVGEGVGSEVVGAEVVGTWVGDDEGRGVGL